MQPEYRASLPQLGPGLTGRSSRTQHVQLPCELVRGLDSLLASSAVRSACGGGQPTRFIAYLALTQLWLCKLTGQQQGAALIVHDSGRQLHPMLSDMVCCTVNTLRAALHGVFQPCLRPPPRPGAPQWGDTLQHAATPITHVVADTPALDLQAYPSFNFLELDRTAWKDEDEDEDADEDEAKDEATDEQSERSALSTLDIEFQLTRPLAPASHEQEPGPLVSLTMTWQDSSAHVEVESLVRLLEQVTQQPDAVMEQTTLLPSHTQQQLVERREQAEHAASRAAQLPSDSACPSWRSARSTALPSRCCCSARVW